MFDVTHSDWENAKYSRVYLLGQVVDTGLIVVVILSHFMIIVSEHHNEPPDCTSSNAYQLMNDGETLYTIQNVIFFEFKVVVLIESTFYIARDHEVTSYMLYIYTCTLYNQCWCFKLKDRIYYPRMSILLAPDFFVRYNPRGFSLSFLLSPLRFRLSS